MKRALITGITGQDGSYLCELLLAQGYAVAGLNEAPGVPPPSGVPVPDAVELIVGDLRDAESLRQAVAGFRPTEIYNLAAMSFVADSFNAPVASCDVTGMGVLRLLEVVRHTDPSIRFFQASSSEIFGKASEAPQREMTPFSPSSPYGVAKLFAHQMVITYRDSHNLFACNGILFNHESPRRGIPFVTRKITDGVARIKHGLTGQLSLGNLDTERDWGFAGDYVRCMHLMLQQDTPDDYVIASGQTHQLREFLDIAFAHVGLKWQDHVVVDPRFLRPSDISTMRGDIGKARARLGWEPTTAFSELVAIMVDADMQRVSAEVTK